MKHRTFQWYNVSARKQTNRKDDASCRKLHRLYALNATIITISISLAKIISAIKNIVALPVNINLPQILFQKPEVKNILLALCVEKLHSCITIIETIPTSVALIKNAIIHFFSQKQQKLCHHLSLNFSANLI